MKRLPTSLSIMMLANAALAGNGGAGPTAIPVPALSEYSLATMAILLSLVAVRLFRNR